VGRRRGRERAHLSAPATTPRQDAGRRRSATNVVAVVVVLVAAVVAVVVIARAARDITFNFDDEWLMITQRRDTSLDDLFRPHYSHLLLIPVLIYGALFRLVGLRSYVPYQAVLVVLHVAVCGLLFVRLRRRAPIAYAVVATVLLLFLGTSWQDLLWAFQNQYLLSVSTGIAALLLLDRRTRAADVGALVALLAAVSSSGAGLMFIAAVVVQLAWSRRDRVRLWVPLVPGALWLTWYVTVSSSRGNADNLLHAPGHMVDEGGAVMAGLLGASQTVGVAVLVAATLVLVVTVVRAWPLDGRFAGAIAMVLAIWFLLAFGLDPRVPATEARYVYLGAVAVFLLGGEVLAAWEPRPLRRGAQVALAVVVVALVATSIRVNVERLDAGGDRMRFETFQTRVGWSALALGGPGVDRHVKVGVLPESALYADDVVTASRALDYPLFDRAELLALPPDVRTGADFQLAFAAGLREGDPHGTTVGGRLPIATASGVAADGGCVVVEPVDGTAVLSLHGDHVAATVEPTADDVQVRVRAIADGYPGFPFVTARPGSTRLVRMRPVDLGPWDVEMRSGSAFRVCPVV
jgi:hypothetical protein